MPSPAVRAPKRRHVPLQHHQEHATRCPRRSPLSEPRTQRSLSIDQKGRQPTAAQKTEKQKRGTRAAPQNLLEGLRTRAAHDFAIPKDGGPACRNAVRQPPRLPQVEKSLRQSVPSHRQASDGCSVEPPQPRNAQQTHPRHPPCRNPSETSEEKSPRPRSSETPNLNGTQTPDTEQPKGQYLFSALHLTLLSPLWSIQR